MSEKDPEKNGASQPQESPEEENEPASNETDGQDRQEEAPSGDSDGQPPTEPAAEHRPQDDQGLAQESDADAGDASDEGEDDAEAEIDEEGVEEDENDEDGQEAVPPATRQSEAKQRPGTKNTDAGKRQSSRAKRRTISRELRRQRQHRRQTRKRLIYGIGGGLISLVLIIGIAVPAFVGLFAPQQSTNSSAGTQVTTLPLTDLADGATYSSYVTVPPTSGPSYTQPLAWGEYNTQQPDETMVRNLAQGGITVAYNLTDQTEIDTLKSTIEGMAGYPGCYIVEPYDAIKQGSIVLAAWGWIQTFTSVDTTGITTFVTDHRNNDPQIYVGPDCTPATTPTPSASATLTPSATGNQSPTETPPATGTPSVAATPTGAGQ